MNYLHGSSAIDVSQMRVISQIQINLAGINQEITI
ncbi:Uncharacterised protein [Yersinia aleksiciae]|uniref:Uncharacterized protein n=1 Tax=Yersinia aleksiciae TaxID=263819 RepID=A0A0T9TTT2_YERAE|nr:Uncharacterised protein [Yersinia aleksiciae]CNL01810.1 Uncharacterised protein [Yersinia aleksiciae]